MRHLQYAVFLLVLTPFALLADEPAGELPGLTKERPAEGRFVETGRGFMVPYTVKLPMQVGDTVASFKMVPILGGTFRFGSPESEPGRDASEGPAFEVKVEPFWIADKEVTWAEFQSFMAMGMLFLEFQIDEVREFDERDPAVVSAPSEIYDLEFVYANGEEPNLPAATMSQYAAKQYTKWLSLLTGPYYRLPTEAEWDYAARAGSSDAYFFGDDASRLGDYAWYEANSNGKTHTVGQKKPNPWGLYDVYGNVAEWTLDAYTSDGYAKAEQRGETTAAVFEQPTKLYPRTLRGGNYTMDSSALRSASRWPSDDWEWLIADPEVTQSPWWFTEDATLGVGFRIVRPLDPPADAEGRERFWKADLPKLQEAVDDKERDGRGARGVVDAALPAAKLEFERRKK
ncbi:MAG TPA: formylglycine-generating enzyme family protein [Pirellulaceae bacterium]|nr:formylglycine-generating enzyme family protein [Pirellulaceae bacterium]